MAQLRCIFWFINSPLTKNSPAGLGRWRSPSPSPINKLTSISQAQVEGLTSLEGSFITSDILWYKHQLIGSLSHSLQGFIHPRWCRISSINSMTWFDFFWCSQNFDKSKKRRPQTVQYGYTSNIKTTILWNFDVTIIFWFFSSIINHNEKIPFTYETKRKKKNWCVLYKCHSPIHQEVFAHFWDGDLGLASHHQIRRRRGASLVDQGSTGKNSRFDP